MFSQATYIWIDGAHPTQKLRCKTKILRLPESHTLEDFPCWGFDGSSTYQAIGHRSDLVLKPVRYFKNSILTGQHYLVLCEVLNLDASPHSSNTRADLRTIMDLGAAKYQPWIGFEQEYVLFQGNQPLGWPERGYPAPQGPFYCGVGADEIFGRDLVEEHTRLCLEAGIMLFGTNAEVMPGQWEFQIGYRDLDSETPDPLTVADHVWVARWLLYRIGENYNINASLDPKPIKGDWNGSGQHTNFSTQAMRDPSTGQQAMADAIDRLSRRHAEHIAVYGHNLGERLTGEHETANIQNFSTGVGDRTASIRIPPSVAEKGYGYIEDRRPGANADPYQIAAILLETICDMMRPKDGNKDGNHEARKLNSR